MASAEDDQQEASTNGNYKGPTITVQHMGGKEGVASATEVKNFRLTPASTGLSDFRSASPASGLYLALPSKNSAQGGHRRSLSATSLFNENGVSSGLADEKLLIKSFEVLADAIGFKKSFSTSDILGIENRINRPHHNNLPLQRSHSDMQLSEAAPLFRLEAASRSLSTWVAVGDTSATTQLPSPQARIGSAAGGHFTAADLVRSVNKKIRQTYLRKRLLTTYKALERMSQSGFNLEKLKEKVEAEGGNPELLGLLTSSQQQAPPPAASGISQLGVASTGGGGGGGGGTSSSTANQAAISGSAKSGGCKSAAVLPASKNNTLSSKEIERDRGKPLSKFDRNVMIFDWLHTLDETATMDSLT